MGMEPMSIHVTFNLSLSPFFFASLPFILTPRLLPVILQKLPFPSILTPPIVERPGFTAKQYVGAAGD